MKQLISFIIVTLFTINLYAQGGEKINVWRTNIAISSRPFIDAGQHGDTGLFDGFYVGASRIYNFNSRWNFQAQLSYSYTKIGQPSLFFSREAGSLHLVNGLAGVRYYISKEERKVRASVIILAGAATGRDRHIPFNTSAYNHPIPIFSICLGYNIEFNKHFNLEIANEGPYDGNVLFKLGYAF
jgi:hypothetical protein